MWYVNKMSCGICGKGLTPSDWMRSFVIYRESCFRRYSGNDLFEATNSINFDYEKLFDLAAKGLTYIDASEEDRILNYKISWHNFCWFCNHNPNDD